MQPTNDQPSSIPLAKLNLPQELPNFISDALTKNKSDRNYSVLRMRFGIGNHKAYTLDEVGKYYEFTRERTRQIELVSIQHLRALLFSRLKKKPEYEPSVDFATEAYNLRLMLASMKDIEREDVIIRAIADRYGVSAQSLDVAICRILLTIFEFTELATSRAGIGFPIHKAWIINRKVELKPIFIALKGANTLLRQEAIKLPYTDLKIKVNQINKSNAIKENDLRTALYISAWVEQPELNVYQYKFRHLRNVADQSFRILCETKRPLTSKTIYGEIKHRLALEGDHGAPEYRTFANALVSDPRFVPIGRSGEWSLIDWSSIVTDSIVDLMQQVFHERHTPLKPQEIYEYVSQRRPVKINSIKIYLSTNPLFKQVGTNLYALTLWEDIPIYTPKRRPKFQLPIGEMVLKEFQKLQTTRINLAQLVKVVAEENRISPTSVYHFVTNSEAFQLEPSPEHSQRHVVVLVKPEILKHPIQSVRTRCELTITEILQALPGHSIAVVELKKQVMQRLALGSASFYQYLAGMKTVKKIKEPITKQVMCTLIGEEFTFPQLKDIEDFALKESLVRAVGLLTEEYVDLGLFELGKIFENTVKRYLEYARDNHLFAVSDENLQSLNNMVAALRKANVVTDESVLSILRVKRNDRAHSPVPDLAERRFLMRSASIVANMYIDAILFLREKMFK